jgi:hypothetical protein
MIQADFAKDNKPTRTEYLREEVKRALKSVPPEQRKAFLKGLSERFPSGYPGQPSTAAEGERAQSVVQDDLRSPEQLVDRLVDLAPGLSTEQKRMVADRLQAAGILLPAAAPDQSDASSPELKSKLRLNEELCIRADRMAALLILLVDFASKLEPLVWNTWRTLAPRSTIRPPRGLSKALGQFLAEESPAVDQKAQRELKMLQRLVAAIITAIGGVGQQFAKSHLARFSPVEIAGMVHIEGFNRLRTSPEKACWLKYQELAAALTEDALEADLRKAIADYAEALMKGLNR